MSRSASSRACLRICAACSSKITDSGGTQLAPKPALRIMPSSISPTATLRAAKSAKIAAGVRVCHANTRAPAGNAAMNTSLPSARSLLKSTAVCATAMRVAAAERPGLRTTIGLPAGCCWLASSCGDLAAQPASSSAQPIAASASWWAGAKAALAHVADRSVLDPNLATLLDEADHISLDAYMAATRARTSSTKSSGACSIRVKPRCDGSIIRNW